jgi:hypothetical protein
MIAPLSPQQRLNLRYHLKNLVKQKPLPASDSVTQIYALVQPLHSPRKSDVPHILGMPRQSFGEEDFKKPFSRQYPSLRLSTRRSRVRLDETDQLLDELLQSQAFKRKEDEKQHQYRKLLVTKQSKHPIIVAKIRNSNQTLRVAPPVEEQNRGGDQHKQAFLEFKALVKGTAAAIQSKPSPAKESTEVIMDESTRLSSAVLTAANSTMYHSTSQIEWKQLAIQKHEAQIPQEPKVQHTPLQLKFKLKIQEIESEERQQQESAFMHKRLRRAHQMPAPEFQVSSRVGNVQSL